MADKIENLLPGPKLPEPTLFDSTSVEAGRVAVRFRGRRYLAILSALKTAGSNGMCIFEVARAIGCLDHQISGRFGELVDGVMIQRNGQRRAKPDTGCECDVYEITLTGLAFYNAASAASNFIDQISAGFHSSSNAPQPPVEGGAK